MDLRREFFSQLLKMAKEDKKIILITCDLGFSFCEEFQNTLPLQFINAGIAEQNAVGVAAGLAIGGYKPYVYSNALFLTSRANEFVRDDICYNKLDVKLVGTDASGFLGFTHNREPSDEDRLLIGHFPNIKLFFPKIANKLKEALSYNGAVYIGL